MRTTQESLYSADTSATESTHSGLKNLQRVHNLLSTHFLGTPGQQYRLKRSLMRYNWGNLPFDMREASTETPDQAPVEDGGTQEQEDLSNYITSRTRWRRARSQRPAQSTAMVRWSQTNRFNLIWL